MNSDASGVRTKRRRASPTRFLTAQTLGRCKPFCIRQLARVALERQRPPRMCGNSSRIAAQLPSVTIRKHQVTKQCGASGGPSRFLDERPGVNCGAWCDALRCHNEDQAQGTAGAAQAGRPGPAARWPSATATAHPVPAARDGASGDRPRGRPPLSPCSLRIRERARRAPVQAL